jgi:hypothetical protein
MKEIKTRRGGGEDNKKKGKKERKKERTQIRLIQLWLDYL